jgi:hypothetical protein
MLRHYFISREQNLIYDWHIRTAATEIDSLGPVHIFVLHLHAPQTSTVPNRG